MVKKIRIRYDPSLLLRDLIELFEDHAEGTYFDADRGETIVEYPDDYLLDELDNRGLKYEVIEE